MSIINYAAKVINFKLVYYGPGMAGKTANLQFVHRCLPDDNRGNMISLATGDDRTLFFDFLPVSATSVRGFTTKFQLYTVPGQSRYNMTRKLVLRGVDGVVFVADSQWDRLKENVESLRNLNDNLREYRLDLATVPYVVQYNKRDLPDVAPIDFLEYTLNRGTRRVPAFEGVAATGQGDFDALNTLARTGLLRVAIFDDRTSVGMVPLFAGDASPGPGAIRVEARRRPRRTGVLAAPLTPEEARSAIRQRPA